MAVRGLFLDSSPERAALMYQRLPSPVRDETVWARTVKEARHVLRDPNGLQFVSLEHDLNDHRHPLSPESGMEIVRFLERRDPRPFRSCLFVVHSWREDLSSHMRDRLERAGYRVVLRPFGD